MALATAPFSVSVERYGLSIGGSPGYIVDEVENSVKNTNEVAT